MTRHEFTKILVQLLSEMIEEGERPLIDYVKRSAEEQMRLYQAGLSKADGKIIVSKHQLGRAADIYFVDETQKQLIKPYKGWTYWHKRWEELGGKPMISWDLMHFEV